MGSESATKEFEVRKTHSRNRSKLKQEKEEVTLNANENSEILDNSEHGTVLRTKKTKGKKSMTAIDEGSENKATDNTEIKRTRRGKRLGKKGAHEQDSNIEDCVPKRAKKESSEIKEKEETDEGDGNNDIKKPKKPSKRQIKREKAEQRETLKKEASKQEATEKALIYISKWKHARSEWKFEKLRQIWLMDNLLDDKLISDAIFPTVLEYFEGCKGMAREQLLKKGMDVIRKHEEKEETSEESIESVEYKRARQLLQALPTET